MKKRGFGAGFYNGFGGKLEDGETLETAAVRELCQEVNIKTQPEHLKKTGELEFIFPYKPAWNQVAHVYFVKQWDGTPVESEEMTAEWIEFDKIPYEKMWEADKYWIPLVLQGRYVKASFVYGENKQVIQKKITTHNLN